LTFILELRRLVIYRSITGDSFGISDFRDSSLVVIELLELSGILQVHDSAVVAKINARIKSL
jgi:hypothetical protein